MSRGLLKVLVFVCIVKFANSTENDKSIEIKKENRAARLTDIITKPAKFVKGIFNPFLNLKGFLLVIVMAGFYGVVYASPNEAWARNALDSINYDGALTKLGKIWSNSEVHIWEVLGSFGPTFAALFIFLVHLTFRFGKWANISFLLLWVLSRSPMKYFQNFDVSIFNSIGNLFSVPTVNSLPPALSVVSFCFMFLFSLVKFQYSKEDHVHWKEERVAVAPPMQTTKAPTKEPKTLNSGTTETPPNVQKKEDIKPTEQKPNPTATIPAKKFDAMKLQPKKPEPEAQSINWVAWVPIIIASVFGVGIVVGICYYKCCTRKSELGLDIDPNDVAAMQNYETRRNTRNEFGQKF